LPTGARHGSGRSDSISGRVDTRAPRHEHRRTIEQGAATASQDTHRWIALQWRLPSHRSRRMNAPTDLAALKARQRTAWASGDYAVIGTTLQIVGESLAEACDLRTDERVLDVAAGNGNATLAAARRGCRVTSTDYVGALLERGAERAAAERLQVSFHEADAEA